MKINKEGEVQKDNMHMLIFVVSLNYVFATYLVFQDTSNKYSKNYAIIHTKKFQEAWLKGWERMLKMGVTNKRKDDIR